MNRTAVRLSLQEAIERAAAAQRSGDLAEAASLCSTVLEVAPEHFDALLLSGVVEHQRGNANRAVQLLSRALAVDPRSFEALVHQGLVLSALRRHEEAVGSGADEDLGRAETSLRLLGEAARELQHLI